MGLEEKKEKEEEEEEEEKEEEEDDNGNDCNDDNDKDKNDEEVVFQVLEQRFTSKLVEDPRWSRWIFLKEPWPVESPHRRKGKV